MHLTHLREIFKPLITQIFFNPRITRLPAAGRNYHECIFRCSAPTADYFVDFYKYCAALPLGSGAAHR